MKLGRSASRTVVGALIFASVPFVCAAQPMPARPHVLTVSGQGDVRAVPDEAQLSAGVTTQAKTAAAALAANSTAMTEVFKALRKRGVPEKSISTSNFSITPMNPPYRQDMTDEDRQKIIGYQVSNQVSVVLDDTSKVGATLDALVASGANQASGVSFTIHDPKPLLTQAREEAVKDAVAKAQTLAKAAGVTLGPILSISEGGGIAPQPMFERTMKVSAMAAAPPTPMAAGEQTVSANVAITWEIQ